MFQKSLIEIIIDILYVLAIVTSYGEQWQGHGNKMN